MSSFTENADIQENSKKISVGFIQEGNDIKLESIVENGTETKFDSKTPLLTVNPDGSYTKNNVNISEVLNTNANANANANTNTNTNANANRIDDEEDKYEEMIEKLGGNNISNKQKNKTKKLNKGGKQKTKRLRSIMSKKGRRHLKNKTRK